MGNLHCEYLPLDSLKPYAKNARTHSRKQVKQIADSIRSFGFTNPILIDNANTILAGHGRVEAAKLLGMSDVPCVRLEHMTPEQKRAYVLADNKLALNAGWGRDPGRGIERPDGDRLQCRADRVFDLRDRQPG